MELQLICSCCGQPYYPGKAWEDKLRAIIFGSERYAICPICTQTPPDRVFKSMQYREKCENEVRRLQKLYEEDRQQRSKFKKR